MKKRIIIICAIFLVLGLLSFFAIKYKQKKDEEERQRLIQIKINNIDTKLTPFLNNEKIDSKDALSEGLNKIIDIHNDIESLNKEKNELSINDITKLDDYDKSIDNKISLTSTYNYDNNIESLIKHYSSEEQSEILKIYYQNDIVKNQKHDIEIKENYLKNLNNRKDLIQYLKKHQNEYYVENGKIIYKTDDFKTGFRKYSNELTIEKEIDKGKKIPILMYHGLDNSSWGDSTLFVKTDDFDSQIAYLKENGYTSLFLSEISKASDYDKPIIITFDDGYKDVYDNAFPILKKYGFKADFFVITDWLDGQIYVNSNMIKEMDASGLIEIGSHTLNHKGLGTINEAEQDDELKTSKDKLDALLGKETTTIAYPLGSFTSTTVRLAKKYYKYGLTVSPGYNYSKTYYSLTLNRNKITRYMKLDTFKTKI